MVSQVFPLPVDPRVAMMIAGFDSAGQPIPMTPERFTAVTETWVVTSQTPTEVAGMLNLAKLLYSHAFFVYEFATVAVQQTFIALEAALAHRLDRRNDTLGSLTKRALAEGLIDETAFETLDQGARRLRNGFSHARQQQVWTLGMAAPIIGRVHTTIAALWP